MSYERWLVECYSEEREEESLDFSALQRYIPYILGIIIVIALIAMAIQ